MPKLLVAYTTYDGHAAKIAERIVSALRHDDCAVEMCDLARSLPERPIEDYDGVIAGGPLHGGKHPSQLAQFVLDNRQALNSQASAFFSVSLSAAGNKDQQGDATRCLNEFLEETGWEPTSTSIVAGALLYRQYGFFKRWMMRMIVKCGGGDTDTSRITTAGDELVVVHVKDTMVLDGTPMEIDAVVVWRIVDGKIVEAWDIPAVHT